jgi:hypothetical protein
MTEYGRTALARRKYCNAAFLLSDDAASIAQYSGKPSHCGGTRPLDYQSLIRHPAAQVHKAGKLIALKTKSLGFRADS